MLRHSPAFARLAQGEEVYGLLNSVPSPLLCEMIGYAGYHFVILDMEHLLRGGDELMHCLRACESAGVSPWVRVPEVDEKLIGRLLDAGVEAIVLPRVESAAEVARAIAAAQFPRSVDVASRVDAAPASAPWRWANTSSWLTAKPSSCR